MKHIAKIIFFMLLLSSCSQNKTTPKTPDVKSPILKDSLASQDSIENSYQVNLEEYRYQIDAYNNKYLLRIIPDTSASKQNMMYDVLFTLKSDTIFKQAINMDTIATKYVYNNENEEKINFNKDYYLSEIIYAHVRERYMRLGANLNSKKDSTRIHVNIQFEYIGSKTGKLSIF